MVDGVCAVAVNVPDNFDVGLQQAQTPNLHIQFGAFVDLIILCY